MSTFKMPEKTALLVFEGEYEGAEVRCRLDVGMRTALEFVSIEGAEPKQMIELVERFCGKILVDWNLVTGDGDPIDPSPEALLDQPPGFVIALLTKWGETVVAVPAPLDMPSLNGSTLAAAFVETAPE